MTHHIYQCLESIGSGVGEVKFQVGFERHDPGVADAKIYGCEDAQYSQPYADAGRWVDVAWTRTNMFGAINAAGPNAGAINDFDSMCQRWEWDWPATGNKRRKIISGVTVDQYGNIVPNVTVMLFNTATGQIVDSTISDAQGNYRLGDPNNTTNFAVGYLAGSPDTEGSTVNTLAGV